MGRLRVLLGPTAALAGPDHTDTGRQSRRWAASRRSIPIASRRPTAGHRDRAHVVEAPDPVGVRERDHVPGPLDVRPLGGVLVGLDVVDRGEVEEVVAVSNSPLGGEIESLPLGGEIESLPDHPERRAAAGA
jgi:hypothetical protein